MAQPTQSQVHVNSALTTMSVGYMQDRAGYMHDLFATCPVNRKSGVYFKQNRGQMLLPRAEKRAPGTAAAEAGFDMSTGSYSCEEWAYRHKLPDQVRANFDSPLSADRSSVNHVTQAMLLSREIEFASAFFTTGVWGTDMTGVSGTPSGNQFKQWDDSSSTPIDDIKTGIRAAQKASGGHKPNVLAMGPEVFDALSDHSTILARIQYSQKGIMTPELLAAIFGLEEVVVGDIVYNTAKEGQTESLDFAIGKKALLAYRTKTPQIDVPSAGYVFSWSEFDNVKKNGGAAIRSYYQEDIKSTWYEGESNYDLGVVDSACGYFFNSAVG